MDEIVWGIYLVGFSEYANRDLFSLSVKSRIFTTRISTSRPSFVRWGIWRFSPKPFLIWKHIHVHKVHVYEVYAHEVHEVHAYELHAHKVHTHEVHAREVHAP